MPRLPGTQHPAPSTQNHCEECTVLAPSSRMNVLCTRFATCAAVWLLVMTPVACYMTAWVHEGGVRFLKDIYGHDEEQEAKLWPDSN